MKNVLSCVWRPKPASAATVENNVAMECTLDCPAVPVWRTLAASGNREVPVDPQTGAYRFVAVEAPQDYLIAISTTNSDVALGTTSASSIPSSDVSAPSIDLSATLCASSGGGTP